MTEKSIILLALQMALVSRAKKSEKTKVLLSDFA